MENASLSDVYIAIEKDYIESWKKFTDEPIDKEKLRAVVSAEVSKVDKCVIDGLDIGGIIIKLVPVSLKKNPANGVSFVWTDTGGTHHWYPVVEYKRLYKDN